MTAARTSTRSTPSNAASNAAEAANNAIANAKEKAKIAIFTTEGAKIEVALFVNQSQSNRAPMFGGLIAGTHVSAFLRMPEGKTPFLSFVDGHNVQVGTANIRVRYDGVPVIKAMLGKQGEGKTEAWFRVSKNVSDDALALMGARMDRLHVNNKEAATA